jgi:hypothetical protein
VNLHPIQPQELEARFGQRRGRLGGEPPIGGFHVDPVADFARVFADPLMQPGAAHHG